MNIVTIAAFCIAFVGGGLSWLMYDALLKRGFIRAIGMLLIMAIVISIVFNIVLSRA